MGNYEDVRDALTVSKKDTWKKLARPLVSSLEELRSDIEPPDQAGNEMLKALRPLRAAAEDIMEHSDPFNKEQAVGRLASLLVSFAKEVESEAPQDMDKLQQLANAVAEQDVQDHTGGTEVDNAQNRGITDDSLQTSKQFGDSPIVNNTMQSIDNMLQSIRTRSSSGDSYVRDDELLDILQKLQRKLSENELSDTEVLQIQEALRNTDATYDFMNALISTLTSLYNSVARNMD